MCDAKEFTRAYDGLLRHYRVGGQKIQAGQANENGDIEQRHYRLKQAAEQALLLRGSRDFPAVAAYQLFLTQAVYASSMPRPAGTLSGRGGATAATARAATGCGDGGNEYESVRAVW